MKYAKAIVAGVGLVVTSLTAAFADNVFDMSEIGAVVTAGIEAILLVAAVVKIENKKS